MASLTVATSCRWDV